MTRKTRRGNQNADIGGEETDTGTAIESNTSLWPRMERQDVLLGRRRIGWLWLCCFVSHPGTPPTLCDAFSFADQKMLQPLPRFRSIMRHRRRYRDVGSLFGASSRSQESEGSSPLQANVDDSLSATRTAAERDKDNIVGAVEFGQAVPLRRKPTADEADPVDGEEGTIFAGQEAPGSSAAADRTVAETADGVPSSTEIAQRQRRKNAAVAVLAVLLSVANYLWEYAHPVTPVQVLADLESTSSSVTVIGRNDRPTLVDFWAPWCDNCKLEASTLRQVRDEYVDRINFVMVNGDKPESWPLIEAFGVDAIPHMAFVDAAGNVETALIGPIPKHVLEADLDALLARRTESDVSAGQGQGQQQRHGTQLPYTMLDVFAHRPEERRVHFDKDYY